MFSAIFLSSFLLLLLVLDHHPADATFNVVVTDDGNGHNLYNGHCYWDTYQWMDKHPGQGFPPPGLFVCFLYQKIFKIFKNIKIS
jgi:hypothetical protein